MEMTQEQFKQQFEVQEAIWQKLVKSQSNQIAQLEYDKARLEVEVELLRKQLTPTEPEEVMEVVEPEVVDSNE